MIPWSEPDLSVFSELVIARVPYKDMIGRLSVPRSVQGLRNRARRIGIVRHTSQYHPWSEEEEDKFVRLAKANHTDEEIRANLGGTRTTTSIKMKRRSMGLPTYTQQTQLKRETESRRWCKEEADKLVQLVMGGHTDKEIQAELGGTREINSIAMKRNRLRLPSNKQQKQLLMSKKEEA